MNTIRENIIGQFETRAAVIRKVVSPPSGYETDCGENVFRVRPKVSPNELPCIVIWPQPEKAASNYGISRQQMTIKVEGVMRFGSTNPSVVAEMILGDLIKCFTSTGWERSPEYIESLFYSGGGTDAYPEEGTVVVGAFALFVVTYDTLAGDPYNNE